MGRLAKLSWGQRTTQLHCAHWKLGTGIVAAALTWATVSVGAGSSQVLVVDRQVECEVLVVGGGLAGTATAYEALLAGRTVCLTE